MSVNDTEKPPARYTLRPTFTPLPHKPKRNEDADAVPARPVDERTVDELGADAARAANVPDDAASHTANKSEATVLQAASESSATVLRAANEDDDLYDPYSDFHDGTLKPLEFERDPWR